MLKVIDVSQWNKVTNWTSVAKNADAVIIRAGYRGYGSAGTLATDLRFKANIDGATKAGMPVGIYWCSQAISEAEARQEAAYCHSLIRSYKITYPVYLDSEKMSPSGTGRGDKLSKADRTKYGLAFCEAVKAYGYTVGLYCSESWYTANIDGAAFKRAGFETWIAKYSTVKPRFECDAWQYTSSGRVTGISGNVDLSHFYKTYGEKAPDAIDTTIQNAIKDIGLNSPDYWEAVLRGKKTATAGTIKALMDKYHAVVSK